MTLGRRPKRPRVHSKTCLPNELGLKIVHGDSYIIIKNKINKQSRNLYDIKVMISSYLSDEF
jgi:hypothetical protein